MATTDINVRLVDETKRGFAQINSNLKGLQGQTASLTSGFVKLGAAIATSFAVKGVVETAAKFQDLRTSLSLLMKDADAGAQAFDNIKKFATSSIFSVEQLTESFIKLKAAGIEPTNDLLNTFQDTAAIAADSVGAFQAITDLFARTTAGGLGLEELNRLADRGIPVFDILNEKLGVTRLEISEVGKSAQGAQLLLGALQEGLNERFGGAVEGRLNNVSQAFNNLGDAIDNASDAIGQGGLNEALATAAKTMTDFITANMEGFKEFGALVGDAIMLVVNNVKELTAAFVAYFTVVAVGKIIAIAEAFGVLNAVVSKNPLIKLLTLGGGALAGLYTYFKMGSDGAKELTEEIDKSAESAEKLQTAIAGPEGGASIAEALKLQTASLSGEIESLTTRYQASNDAIREKLRLETEAVGLSESQQRLAEMRGEAEQKLADELAKIAEKKLKIQNDLGKGEQYRAEATRQLEEAEAKIVAQSEAHVAALTELVEANKKALEVEKLREYSFDRQVELQREVRQVQDEIAKVAMTDIEKKYYDIQAAARESAEAQIAEYARINKIALESVPKEIVDEYYDRAYEGVEKLKQIHQEHYEISRTWETGWEIAFKKYVENATNASQQAQKVFDTTVRGMEDLFVDFMMKGEANWKEFINSIIEQLLRAELQKLIASVFSGIMGGGSSDSGGGGFLGSILGGIGKAIFGGFFAQGGYLPAGKIGIAGENGPELITGPANITPMNGMGGNVTYNINAVDARSFQELLAKDPAAVHAILDRSRRQLGMGIV